MNSAVLNQSSTGRSEPQLAERKRGSFLWLLAIVLLTIAAYSPVLFNAFIGDDFVHLTWLSQAIHQPELIWRNFHSSWLDGTTTKFYRPLISVFMVTDYAVWGVNGFGFKLTNLLFHLTSSILIFAITAKLSNRPVTDATTENNTRKDVFWPLLASAIFALYPLHPEAVSWITGRVDSIVTTFCLASLWFYMQWRDADLRDLKSWLWCAAGLSAFILGLLSKEMAITVPAVLVCYELFILAPEQKMTQRSGYLRYSKNIFCLAPFWVLLAGYFVVRRIALGTFVGGYDDSLFFIADIKAFAYTWLHALRMLVVPINKLLIGAHNHLTKLWEVFLIGQVSLSALALITQRRFRARILFLSAWLVLSLLPVYKIFAITDDLQGSRLAYLATAPLAVLLAYGFAALRRFAPNHAVRRSSIIFAVTFVVLNAGLLWFNNQPWKQAGQESNAIRSALGQLYSTLPGDPEVMLIGLPDQINGAYTCRNALWGMTKAPQMQRDVMNCLMVNYFEPIFPFGFLKDSMLRNAAAIKAYRWVSEQQDFAPVDLPAIEQKPATTVYGAFAITPDEQTSATSPSIDGTLIWSRKPGTRPAAILDLREAHPWFADFVRVKADFLEGSDTKTGCELIYGDCDGKFLLEKRTHASATASGPQELLFALRSLPEWSMGQSRRLKLMLPPGTKAVIRSAELVNADTVIPKIDFANSGYLGTKGYLHLGVLPPGAVPGQTRIESQRVMVDASKIPGAVKSEIELTRPNLLFEEQNTNQLSKRSSFYRQGNVAQDYNVSLKDLPAVGMYELRAWALDADGHRLGRCSDHIVISVNP